MTQHADEQYLSIGGVAQALGVSPSGLRKLEKLGVIPPAARLVGSDRRLYRLGDVEMIRERVKERESTRRTAREAVPA